MTFLHNLWYLAGSESDWKVGPQIRQMFDEPLITGTMPNGALYAMRDACPHRGMPLSRGKVLSDSTIQCCYHGWQFGADGKCTKIPSLVDDRIRPEGYSAKSYPVRIQDGLVWIYYHDYQTMPEPRFSPPKICVGGGPRWAASMLFRCSLDEAVTGLMDPAHAKYIHDRPWFKVTPGLKEKLYGRSDRGFVMKRHKPVKSPYKLLDDVETEIAFELPSLRFEHITGTRGKKPVEVLGFTACTPITALSTRVTQIFFYQPASAGWFVKPYLWFAGKPFMNDDRKAVEWQSPGIPHLKRQALIPGADTPTMWYNQLKRTWAAAVRDGTQFTNPLPEEELVRYWS